MTMDHVPISREELEELDERDLMEFVADQVADNKLAERAYTVLYQKHFRLLAGRVFKMIQNFGYSVEDAKDLVQDTMMEVFKKANTFYVPPDRDGKRIRNGYLKWVFTIAKNKFFENHRRVASPTLISLSDENFRQRVENIYPETLELSDERKRLLEAVRDQIDGLPNHKKEILLSYLHYGFRGMKVPKADLDQLADRHGTTRDNMRQIYARVKKQLEKTLRPLLDISQESNKGI